MKNNNLPITLSQILFNVPDSDFVPTRSSLANLTFDTHRDFIMSRSEPILAVRMTFANERCINGKCYAGLRRKVTVTLVDSTDLTVHTSVTASVNIKSGRFSHTVNTWLTVNFNMIELSHPYLIVVRDDKSGQILGERPIRFFLPYHYNYFMTEWVKPDYGGFKPNFTDMFYKSCEAEIMAYHHVEFHLTPCEPTELPPLIPEMEVKTYFPDGTVESKCYDPVAYKDDEDDDKEMFQITAPFYMTESKRGICYAQLLCFDEAIAGFVFNTAGDDISGSCRYDNLAYIEEYSLEEASRRFRQLINHNINEDNDNNEPEKEDPFDHLLEDFIKLQSESDTSSTSEEEQEQAKETQNAVTPQVNEDTISPLYSLRNLTGLHSVKEKLTAYEKLVIFNKKRQECDLPTLTLPLHAMFCGSPGTGKTTVAKRMGLMLKRAGVLSKGHVVIKERSSLIGKHYGDEETNTRAAIEEAQGGILFIDEAYQLYQPMDPKDPGKFVIETLMTVLADEAMRDWMLILAGYTEDMKRMFEMNPGLKSRIPDSNIYIFDDFTEPELMEIAERYLERHQFAMTDDARTTLATRLGDDYHHRDKNFGNARHVINMIQSEILPSMASRVVTANNFNPSALSLIQSCDIPSPQNLTRPNRPRIGYRA